MLRNRYFLYICIEAYEVPPPYFAAQNVFFLVALFNQFIESIMFYLAMNDEQYSYL